MSVPALDYSVGMEVYSTKMSVIDGKIKHTPDHFIVEEILDSLRDLTAIPDDEHEYPLYMMTKDGIDSTHAIQEVETMTGLKLKIVGLKDARAVTRQYVSVSRKRKDAKHKLVTKHCTLDLLGYTSRPIVKGELVANRFAITIDNFHGNVEQCIDELQVCIDKNTIANFYGYQRFGSARPVTHLVGREIVKRNFRNAIDLFLCYSSEYDNQQNKEIRDMCRDSSNFANVLQIMPSKMDLERMLITELMRSNDPVRAFRSLPVTMRRLFVQAYQSYIFNRTLSIAVKEEYDITSAEPNDMCFFFEQNNLRMMCIKRFDANAGVMQLPAIPLAGYAFRDDNRFSTLVKKIMEEESVSMKDFYVKDLQEVSLEGGFRQASMLCREFSYVLNGSLQLKFILPKGSYATVLLRELIKPNDPIMAGF
jgi:tRNA pseudouridine13 synthase